MVTHAASRCLVGPLSTIEISLLKAVCSSLQVFSGLTGQQTLSPLYTYHTVSQNSGEISKNIA